MRYQRLTVWLVIVQAADEAPSCKNRMLALATQRLSTLKQAHLTPQKLLMLSQQALPLLRVQKGVLAQLQNPHLLLRQRVPQARPRRPLPGTSPSQPAVGASTQPPAATASMAAAGCRDPQRTANLHTQGAAQSSTSSFEVSLAPHFAGLKVTTELASYSTCLTSSFLPCTICACLLAF